MKERPISATRPEVRAILDGRKTMTRRIVKPQPIGGDKICKRGMGYGWIIGQLRDSENAWRDLSCPYGQPGDRLWVRETWRIPNGAPRGWVDYRADDAREGFRWRPSIYMPRWASRITLEITDIRVERLQDISEEDAQAEGVKLHTEYIPMKVGFNHRQAFGGLWESINGPGSWDANPWVWAIEFKRVEQAGKAEGSRK